MVETNKYWRSVFFVPWYKTLWKSKTVSQGPPTDEHFDHSGFLKNAFLRRFCFAWALYFNVFKLELGHKFFDQI